MTVITSQEDLHREASELHRALSGLVQVLKSQDRQSVGLHDVSVTQCHALDTLARGGSMTLGELSAELFLDKSTASRVVDSLVRKAYASRTVDPTDARVRRLAVTMKGRELHRRIECERIKGRMELIADFAPEVRREATELVDRLARAAAQRCRVKCG